MQVLTTQLSEIGVNVDHQKRKLLKIPAYYCRGEMFVCWLDHSCEEIQKTRSTKGHKLTPNVSLVLCGFVDRSSCLVFTRRENPWPNATRRRRAVPTPLSLDQADFASLATGFLAKTLPTRIGTIIGTLF
jgi:hypothetical protein